MLTQFPHLRRVAPILVLVLAGAAAVSAPRGVAAADDKKRPAAAPFSENDGPLELVTDADKVKEFAPLVESSGAFQIQSGKKPVREVEYRIERDRQDRDLWVYTLGEAHVTYMKRGKNGGVVIPREIDPGEHVDITYEPALQMLPADWNDGPVIEGAAAMTVKNSKTGLVREKGTCTYRVELVGKQKVHTGVGDFEALVVRETRHIRLNLAKSDVTSTSWFVPQRGEVAEHVEEVTKALGFIGGLKIEDRRLSK